MPNYAFLSFSMQAGQPANVSLMRCRLVIMLSLAVLVMLCSQTIVPNFDRSTEKYAHQNIQNECQQWLSHSIRVQCTILYSLSLLKTRSFFSIASAVIMFSSLVQTDGHRYHDSTLPKTPWWIENCTKFGQFILSKIIKIVATRLQILRLKCTKFDFGWGSAPDPAGGAYSAPQTPQLDLFELAYF